MERSEAANALAINLKTLSTALLVLVQHHIIVRVLTSLLRVAARNAY